MSPTNTPNTPETTPIGRAALKRSFTVPPKFSTPAKTALPPTAEIGAAEGIETLYVHPSARVVSFSTARSSSRPASRQSMGDSEGTGALPWASPTERTLAAGPLEIYRVPGSVSFLHSGALLHAILPRSQCWCVDGVSKFAFRVLADTYYRIELPGDTDEDKRLVEELKVTLQKVLWYERTACPFQRSFTVDLPETPTSPRRRSLRPAGPAKKWTFNRRWKPEGEEEEEVGNDDDARSRRSSSADVSDLDASPAASARPLAVQKPRNQAQGVLDDAVSQEHGKFVRPGKLSSLRSVTAPPQLTLQPSPPSKSQPTYGLGIDGTLDKAIAQSTTPDTKLEAPRTPELPPTPVSIEYTRPDPFVSEAGAERSNDHGHITSDAVGQREDTEEDERRESGSESDSYTESLSSLLPDKLVLESEATVNEPGEEDAISQTPSDPVESTTSDTTSESSTEFHEAPAKPTTFTVSPTLTDDSEDVFYSQPSTSPETLRRRRAHGTRSQRSSSPSGTSATSMASLYRVSSTDSQRALTGAIMRKTCSIFLGPPAHLVALMLRIAATIANGAFAFTVHTPEGMHRRVPGSWDLSDDEDDWDIDDYGYPLDKDAVTRRIKRESWGVD